MKPKHYKTKDKDVIDFCKDYDLNFNRGNIVKYVARADKKGNELEDLLKAKDYIKREIKFLKKNKRKEKQLKNLIKAKNYLKKEIKLLRKKQTSVLPTSGQNIKVNDFEVIYDEDKGFIMKSISDDDTKS
jgi:hypothetical protein